MTEANVIDIRRLLSTVGSTNPYQGSTRPAR
jgi:hypothetical protein